MRRVLTIFDDEAASVRGKILALYAVLLSANGLAWLWALLAFRDHPVLLGTSLLAYTFGLRHAVDADHIAAIDNVTRKLMQDGKRPCSVGFFFSLGHSTIVVIGSVLIAVTTAALQGRFSWFHALGSTIATTVSALFLFAVALANIAILVSVYRTFVRVREGGPLIEADLDLLLSQRGFLGRFFKSLFRIIGKSWHMYPLGLLFGLGFDTATEIGLLGISAAEASNGLSIWSILAFPALFTAGMSLVDTTDGILMLGAYGWAFVKPIRKLYYNMTITLVSVLVALLIGGVEILGLVVDRMGLAGGLWSFIGALNENFGAIGYLIIGLFAFAWIVSAAIYRIKGYDRIDVRIA